MKQEDKADTEEGGEISEKKPKKRQRKILADLKAQIEFYFSEPNLQKDRFLRQRIQENPNGCIKIETIASFNRMKQLCSDIGLVVKAMKMCSSIEVVDEKWVKPSKPLVKPKNVDAMTVYVECLPKDVDHDWIKSLFSSCGTVVYVSLPRYQPSRVIKGFAFVEFETESEAKKALEMFSKKSKNEDNMQEEDCDEPDVDGKEEEKGGMEVSEKQIAGKTGKKRKPKSSESESDSGKVNNCESKGSKTKKSKKSKHKKEQVDSCDVSAEISTPDSSSHVEPLEKDNAAKKSKKKRKRDDVGEEGTNENESDVKRGADSKVNKAEESQEKLVGGDTATEAVEGSVLASGKRKRKEGKVEEEPGDETVACKKAKTSGEEDSGGEVVADMTEETHKKHKKRKRKKKKSEGDEEEKTIPDLKVISKAEWLRLREEYQTLQREAMKQTKERLRDSQSQAASQQGRPGRADKTTMSNHQSERNDKTEQPTSKKCGDRTEQLASKNEKEIVPPCQKLEMVPGVVLKFSTTENIEKLKLREMFSTVAPLSYLEQDIDGKCSAGYVRFVTKEGCKKAVDAVTSGSIELVTVQELTEKEDSEYWERLNKQRLERFQQKRKPKKRGTQKIADKLEAQARKREHIVFDD